MRKAGGHEREIKMRGPIRDKFAKQTVLITEPDAFVQRHVREILTQHDYQVWCAGSDKEARSICEKNGYPPDLLVSEIVLPEGSGPQLSEELHLLNPSMGTVYISGIYPNLRCGSSLNPAHVLAKPFSPEQLLSQLERAAWTDRPLGDVLEN